MVMKYLKVFRSKNDIELVEYNPHKDIYLEFIDWNRESGKYQLILNSNFLLKLAERFLENDFSIEKICIRENTLISYEDYDMSHINTIEQLAYIKYEVLNFKDDNFIEIDELRVSDSNFDNDITIKSNGIVIIESIDAGNIEDLLLRMIKDCIKRK